MFIIINIYGVIPFIDFFFPHMFSVWLQSHLVLGGYVAQDGEHTNTSEGLSTWVW